MMALAKGRDVLFDIDWQGTQQLRQQAGDDLVSIFVLPPSHAELERRLRVRAQDAEDVVAERMARAGNEISHWAEYDYVVINDDLDTTVVKIRTILAAERMKRSRARPAFPAFVSGANAVGPGARAANCDHAEVFRPRRGVDAGFFQQRFPAQRLQALAQHLAALAEGGGGDRFQFFKIGRRDRLRQAAPAARWTR